MSGSREAELKRLQRYRTRHTRVELPDGEHVHLRRLSPGDAIALDAAVAARAAKRTNGATGEARPVDDDPWLGLATLALSLCDEDGGRLFDAGTLDEGVALVGEWSDEYMTALNGALESMVASTSVEDARRD